jgi:ABC-2 type transport system permease protein
MAPIPPATSDHPPDRPPDRPPAALERVRRFDVLRTFLRVGALNELQYRVNFLLQLFQSLVALGTAIAVIALVFLYTPVLGGWNPSELLIVVGVHTLLGGVIRSLIQPAMQQLMEDIRTGTLDFVLTKPADAQLLVSVRRIEIWRLVDVVVGAGVVVVGAIRAGHDLGPVPILVFLAALGLGVVLIYCLWLAITIGAFWVVRMEHVAELFDGLYQAGRWPVGLYPGWLRVAFTVLVPLAFAVTLPAEALTGRAGLGWLATAAAFTVAVATATRWFWRVGVRNYAGASA